MITVGEQIQILIDEGVKSGNFTVRKLTRGICSRNTLEKVVSGDYTTDPRFLKILIQRLGKSQNKLEYIAQKEFIDLVELQLSFDDSIDRRDGAAARDLMEKIEEFSAFDDYKNIKKMYGLRNRAAYEYYIDCDPKAALGSIEKAIIVTVPGFKAEMLPEYILSTVELENILFKCLMQIETDSRKNMAENERLLIESIFSYIHENITDSEEQAYIIPKVNWVSSLLYLRAGETKKAVLECSEGFELLRSNGMLQMSLPLLKVITENGQGCELPDSLVDYRQYRSLIETLINKYMSPKAEFNSLFFNTERAMYHYEAEVYKGQRQLKQLSQEDIAGMAESSSDVISKYERGKRSPRKTNYAKLMKVLGIDYAKQGTFLISESFGLLEEEREINALLIEEKYNLAEKKLEDLCSKIDDRYWSNRFLLISKRIQIGLGIGTLNPEMVVQEVTKMLKDVYPVSGHDIVRPPFLAESGLVAQLVSCYAKLGRTEDARLLLDSVIETFDKSNVPKVLQQRTYNIHIAKQASYHADDEIMCRAINQRLICRNCNGFDYLLSGHATHKYETDRSISRDYALFSLFAAKLRKSPNVERIKEFIEKWY